MIHIWHLLDYFYENLLSGLRGFIADFMDGIRELVEEFMDLFSYIASWLLGAVLFVTIPLWIVPYKLWKRRGDK